MNYTIHVDEVGEGERGYVGYIDQLPGAISEGEPLLETLANLANAVQLLEMQPAPQEHELDCACGGGKKFKKCCYLSMP